MPIAVRHLREAEHRYREGLGFSIKPGRLHPNSIDNVHIKFADSSALELITASEPLDDVAAFYITFLEQGDGGAFVSFDGGSAERIATHLEVGALNPRLSHGRYAHSVTFDFDDPLSYFFFIEYHRHPQDTPKHLNHPNSATGLYAVWLVSDDFSREKTFFSALDADESEAKVYNPVLATEGEDIQLARGHVYLLPSASHQAAARMIAGVTVLVDDLSKTRGYVEALYGRPVEVYESALGRSIYVAPHFAHGLWIEFLEEKRQEK